MNGDQGCDKVLKWVALLLADVAKNLKIHLNCPAEYPAEIMAEIWLLLTTLMMVYILLL